MKKIFLALIILLLGYCFIACKRYSTDKAAIRVAAAHNAILLDVRTPAEYKRGHLEHTINIPLSKLHDTILPYDMAQTIITCCSHGLRSIKAAELLKTKGYRCVVNGGAWVDLGDCLGIKETEQ